MVVIVNSGMSLWITWYTSTESIVYAIYNPVKKVCISTGQILYKKKRSTINLTYAQYIQWIYLHLSTEIFFISSFFLILLALKQRFHHQKPTATKSSAVG